MPNSTARNGAAGTQDRIGLGIAGIVIGMFAVSIMDALAKWLAAGYPISELVFFRSLFALPLVFFILWQQRGGVAALTPRWRLGHALRASLSLGALFAFFTGLRYLPLAEAISIAFAAPLFVTALSVPILGERVGPRRWAAVVVGFIGVLVMTRPGAEAFRPEALYILAAALCYALSMLVTRRLARSDTTPAIMLSGICLALVVSGLMLPFGWRTPGAVDFLLLALLGLVGGIGMYFMTQAYRYAPAAVIAPFDYTALLWGTLFGWLVWQELPGTNVWLGAAIVVASGLYIVHCETRVRTSPGAAD
jgi:drug/metabolite transporter (DMT)-like permease